MSTQKYIDAEKGWIDSLLSGTPIVEGVTVPIEPAIDIDPDIEKEIALLQEAKFSKKIEEIKLVEEKQPAELTDELGSFFTAITKEKADLTEKIKKEEVKIAGLEDLFKDLSAEKKKKKKVEKKKVLLLEPEKDIEPVEVSEWDKKQQEIDAELEAVTKQIEEREGLTKAIEAESINEYKVPDDMIDKVKKEIANMKNANELDKERINQLSSLDSWEKLKEEFLTFKHRVNVQLGTVGGGGLDPHNIYSDFLPATSNTYDLGSADRTWKDLHLSGSSLVIGGTTMDSGELTVLDSVTAGTVAASKAVIVDSNKDIGTFRNLTISGELDAATLDISGNADIDGTLEADAISINGTAITSTAAEINLIDGGTARGTDALASGDGILINDAGTMKMTNVDTVKTFMQTGLSSEGTGILSTGEGGGTKFLREDGDGTSSWQTVSANVPSSADGQALGSASLEWSDLFLADGGTVTFGNDQDITLTHNADTGLTLNGVMAATALDISGNADIDGTLEADAYTVDGTALNEYIADTVGAMVSSNTETNITVTYEDGDNTLDFVIGTLNQDTTGTAATVTTAAQPNITSLGTLTTLTVDNVIVNGTTIGHTSDTDLITLADGNVTIAGELDLTTLDVSGNADIDGTLEADAYTVDGTALNEYIADTVGAMVTSNTESGITVAYQDGDNTLDFTIGTLNQNTTGTAAVATVATTVTITDNESTNENNAVIFTAGGDVDGGNLGLESDGDLTYNPSTGTLNVPNISVSGTQTIVDSVTMNASNAVVFEGSTVDAYETTLTTVDATADRTINLPNASDTLVGKATTDTLTNKSIDLGTNTLTGSVAEFNSALQSESFATLTGSETFTNKTLASPVFTTQLSIGSAVISEAELETIDGVTAGTVAASKAVVVDANKDISGFRHMTIGGNFLPSATNTYNLGSASKRFNDLFLAGNTIDLAGSTISADGTGTISISADGVTLPTGSNVGGNELAVMGSSATSTGSQVVRRVDFFSNSGGLSTANTTFEFNAEVADRYSFTDASTFTLANGSALADTGITLFQF